jgi:hypothetical protein
MALRYELEDGRLRRDDLAGALLSPGPKALSVAGKEPVNEIVASDAFRRVVMYLEIVLRA